MIISKVAKRSGAKSSAHANHISNNFLTTATLPWTGAPNYGTINLPLGGQIPCFSFGGYSDEVGYTGALFVTNTNVYVYKASSAGELVIELSGCVVRTYNDTNPAVPIVATNKLTFPTNTDGGSVTLCADISTTPFSWWAISQDGSLYYDNTLIGGSGSGGITEIIAGSGINVTPNGTQRTITNTGVNDITINGAGLSVTPQVAPLPYILENTGVTSIVAGTGITISGGTGAVTVNATGGGTGYLQYTCEKKTLQNANSNVIVFTNFPATFFLPNFPRTAIGIASQFDLFNNGLLPPNTGYIRWTGDAPITFQLSMPLNIVISDANQARVSLPNYNGYEYSAFAYYTTIYDQNGSQVGQPQQLVWCAGIGSISTLNQPQSQDFYDYQAQMQIVGTLQKNWYIQVQFVSNAIYNSGTGNHQPVNTFNATAWDTPFMLTCQYLTIP